MYLYVSVLCVCGCTYVFSTDCSEEDKPTNEIIDSELLRLTSREILELCFRLFIEQQDQKSKQVFACFACRCDVDAIVII